MAKISGFKCDGPRCDVVAQSNSADPPPGWLVLTPHVTSNGKPDDDRQGVREVFHLCGNNCLYRLSKARRDADVDAGVITKRASGRRAPAAAGANGRA